MTTSATRGYTLFSVSGVQFPCNASALTSLDRMGRMRLVVFAPFAASESEGSAGAFHDAQLLKSFADHGHRVTFIHPLRSGERGSDLSPDERVDDICVQVPEFHGIVRSRLRTLHYLVNGLTLGPRVAPTIMANVRVRQAVVSADVVLIEFAQTLPLVRSLKKLRPNLPILATEHDVMSVSVRRGRNSGSWRIRTRAALIYKRVEASERAALDLVDQIYILSRRKTRDRFGGPEGSCADQCNKSRSGYTCD